MFGSHASVGRRGRRKGERRRRERREGRREGLLPSMVRTDRDWKRKKWETGREGKLHLERLGETGWGKQWEIGHCPVVSQVA